MYTYYNSHFAITCHDTKSARICVRTLHNFRERAHADCVRGKTTVMSSCVGPVCRWTIQNGLIRCRMAMRGRKSKMARRLGKPRAICCYTYEIECKPSIRTNLQIKCNADKGRRALPFQPWYIIITGGVRVFLLENTVCPFKMYGHDVSQVCTKKMDLGIFWWDRQCFCLIIKQKLVGR